MDESALWEKIPHGKLTVPLWYTTRVFPLWETQRAGSCTHGNCSYELDIFRPPTDQVKKKWGALEARWFDANHVLLRARCLDCDCLQDAASRLHNLQPQHAFF